MKKSKISGFICHNGHGWQDGYKCVECGEDVQAGDTIKIDEGSSTLFTMYRPPRPLKMTPMEYYRKYGIVDEHYTRKTNGRYYCNPAHCGNSWEDKAERDRHVRVAYSVLG